MIIMFNFSCFVLGQVIIKGNSSCLKFQSKEEKGTPFFPLLSSYYPNTRTLYKIHSQGIFSDVINKGITLQT